jgi:hypothetical protein
MVFVSGVDTLRRTTRVLTSSSRQTPHSKYPYGGTLALRPRAHDIQHRAGGTIPWEWSPLTNLHEMDVYYFMIELYRLLVSSAAGSCMNPA